MTGQRFVVAASVIGLIVLTVVLFLTSVATVHTARINSFQRTGDPRKIVVNVIIGFGVDIAERTVREGPQSVSVTVPSFGCTTIRPRISRCSALQKFVQ